MNDSKELKPPKRILQNKRTIADKKRVDAYFSPISPFQWNYQEKKY